MDQSREQLASIASCVPVSLAAMLLLGCGGTEDFCHESSESLLRCYGTARCIGELFCDDFETRDLSRWDTIVDDRNCGSGVEPCLTVVPVGRSANHRLALNHNDGGDAYLEKELSGELSEIWLYFDLLFDDVASASVAPNSQLPLLFLYGPGDVSWDPSFRLMLQVDGSSPPAIYRFDVYYSGESGTSGPLSADWQPGAGQWSSVKVHIRDETGAAPGNRDGVIKIWADGVPVLDHTGLAFAPIGFRKCLLGNHSQQDGTPDWHRVQYFDNWGISDRDQW